MDLDSVASYDDVARKTKRLLRGVLAKESSEVTLVFEVDNVGRGFLSAIKNSVREDPDSRTEIRWRQTAAAPSGPRWFLDKFAAVALDFGCNAFVWDFTVCFLPLPGLNGFGRFATIAQVKIGSEKAEITKELWTQSKAPGNTATDLANVRVISRFREDVREHMSFARLHMRDRLAAFNRVRELEDRETREMDMEFAEFMDPLALRGVPTVLRCADKVLVELKFNISSEMPCTISTLFRENMREVIIKRGEPASSAAKLACTLAQALSRPVPDCIKFVCGETSYYVSKARVLEDGESCSPVIRACFDNSENLESRDDTYPVDDFDEDVVEQFMVFLQWGVTPNMVVFADDLALIADKYQVVRLLEMTEPYLVKEAVESSSWMDSQGRDEVQFRGFLKLCRLAGLVYLPVLLTTLHYLLLDFENQFPQWIIGDEWREFLSSVDGVDFLERRLRAIRTVNGDDFPIEFQDCTAAKILEHRNPYSLAS